MSETIGEMIIPGTYIEVRAEGLIGVGGINTGNVGVVGTANRGPFGEVTILGSYAEALQTFGRYGPWPANPASTPHLTLTRTLEQLFAGGASTVYAVRVANLAEDVEMRSMTWTVLSGATPLFTLTATSPGTWANDIVAAISPAANGLPARLTLTLRAARETYDIVAASALAAEINDASTFVTASGVSEGNDDELADTVTPAPEAERGGPDGAGATAAHISTGLQLLATQPVNILTVAGLSADAVSGIVLGHLESTETEGTERIAVLGTRDDTLSGIGSDSQLVSNRRAVLVAPGIVAPDAARNGINAELTPSYAAALIAGKLSTLAPHISLTNKDVAASGLTTYYTRAQQKQLLQNRIMVLHRNLGIRALRGITTDTGAFRQISVRRIVDYAKAGVRIGSNPYIGRLNNVRVRAALQATLDGFLAQMVQDEMLTDFVLEVTATRAQEINGIAAVNMTLRPTFSIDFIRVTMILA